MRNKILLGALAFLFALAFVGPAGAVTIGVTDFTLFANKRIGMENGGTIINGNVAVNDPLGELFIGAGNTINGTATAHKIVAGTGQTTTECVFDILLGGGAGGCLKQTVAPAGTFPIVAWPPLPVAPLPACVDDPATPNVTVLTTQNLASGCYGVVTVLQNATLNLAAGVYNVKKLVMQGGSTLTGAGSTSTTVNSKQVISIGGTTTLAGVTIQTPLTSTGVVIAIGPGDLTDVLLNAPDGKIHVKKGTMGTNVEVVGNALEIEPVQFGGVKPPVCACMTDVTKTNSTTVHVKGLDLTAFTSFVLKADCNAAGGIATTTAPGGTATDQDLTVPGGTTCTNCHVIGISTGGTFCSADLVTLP